MSLVKTSGTGPERRLRSLLHARGARYRINRRPVAEVRCFADLVFAGPKVAVFVDGCFWHGCPDHASWPKSNAAWWRAKIEKNRSRDAETTKRLSDAGWLVVRVWEHEAPEEAASRIEAAIEQRVHLRGVRRA
jgi:DNA mismatch endonuclease (patch repair protein)